MNPWFLVSTVTAFAAMICFFNVNSAWADKKQPDRNRLLTILGVILAIGAVIFMYIVSKTSTGQGG